MEPGRPARLPDGPKPTPPKWFDGLTTEGCTMDIKVQGDKLVITIDIAKANFDAALPSASGKTKVLASTRGFANYATPHGVVGLSLNATTK